ncbi:MAG: hypothetical protein WCY89_12185 [Flavobacteriaceae bacterium]
MKFQTTLRHEFEHVFSEEESREGINYIKLEFNKTLNLQQEEP